MSHQQVEVLKQRTGHARLVRKGQSDIDVEYELEITGEKADPRWLDNPSLYPTGKRFRGRISGPPEALQKLKGVRAMYTLILENEYSIDVIIEEDGSLTPQSGLRGPGKEAPGRNRAPEM